MRAPAQSGGGRAERPRRSESPIRPLWGNSAMHPISPADQLRITSGPNGPNGPIGPNGTTVHSGYNNSAE